MNMMRQAYYRVVFHGEVDAGRDVEEVKHNLGVLFKSSGDKVDRLFAKQSAGSDGAGSRPVRVGTRRGPAVDSAAPSWLHYGIWPNHIFWGC